MLKDLKAVYDKTLNDCSLLPKTGLRLSPQFVKAYTDYIQNTAAVPGGYVKVEFDHSSALLTSTPTGNSDSVLTCVTTYGFAVAHRLTPLMHELMQYKSRVDQIFDSYSKPEFEALLKELRKPTVPANKLAKLESALNSLPEDERPLVRKFVTQYTWWHGQKGIERDDFMYSPMLSCSKLVATSNGAIPTIAKHFSASENLFSSFDYFTEDVSRTDTNILTEALNCFKKNRANVKAPAGWNNFDAWAKAARSAFDAVDESKATDQNFDYAKFMREFAISVQVANTKFAGHSADEKTAVLKFLREQKVNPQVVTWYLDGTHRPMINGEDVKGMGVTATLFFMMEIHPDLYASWSEMAYDSLSKVGLHSGPAPTKLTLQSYDDCKAKQCQVLAKMNEMGIGKAADDPSDADYITANEFLWFVSEQYDLIMKEWSKRMKKEIKLENQDSIDISKFEDFIKAFHKAAEDAGLTYDLALVKRFVCALLAKPFVVLTGLSGSGKTKLAQAFTQWIAISDTARIVPVGADWANNEKLLGYPNGLDPNNYVLPDTGVLKLMIDANDNPTVPFFLILDEMNLSHVERYFADFLSAMESNGSIKLYDGKNRTADDGTPVPPTIPFPKNLFVIGTMNVDETTHMFSPKVLDRAQVIEFRVTAEQMANYLDNPQKLDMTQVDGKGLKFAEAFLKLHNTPAELDGDYKKTVADALKQFFPTLAELGSEFAFRTASEAKLFCAFARKANLSVEESVDAAIMQKLLPKLHGSRRRLALPLEAFWEFCREDGKTETLGDICKKDATVKVTDVAKYKVSAEKIKRLYKAAETNGFASYAEA